MSGAALIVILLAAALLAGSSRLGRIRRVLGLGHLAATGHVFLVLGFLLGLASGAADPDALEPVLTPMTALVAGTVGFSVGMAFYGRVLRRIPRQAYWVALIPGLATAVVVGPLAGFAFTLYGVPLVDAVACALVLAGGAAASAPTLAAAIRRRRGGQSAHAQATLRLVELSAGLTNLITLACAIVAFALLRADSGDRPLGVWLLLVGAVGVAAGTITWLFLGGRARHDEQLLLGLGMVALTAGLAEWAALSPEALCAVAGATLVNLPGDRMRAMRQTIERLERPAVVILMALVGFYAASDLSLATAALAGLLLLLRTLTLRLTARAVARDLPETSGLRAPTAWGAGLIPMGTLGLVTALTFHQVWPHAAASAVLAALAATSLVSEVLAPGPLTAALRRDEGGGS